SEVTLFHTGDHILNREDADAAEIVQRAFVDEGIRLVLGAKLERVERAGGGKVLLATSPGGPVGVEGDGILGGTGREPNVDGLGLEAVGVAYDRRDGVQVNDRLQTTNPRIYAAGDICMPEKFTHVADAAARVVIQNALFLGRKKHSALTIPWCTYTDPEIAHVGLYARDAEKRGMAVDTYVRPFAEVDRAVAHGGQALCGMAQVAGVRRWVRPVLILALLVAGVVGGRALGLGDLIRLENVARLKQWIEGFGALAPVVFIVGYVLAVVFFVPGLPITVLGGVAFGPVWGTLYVWIAATIGAALSFLVARYAVRSTVERWVRASPR